MGTGWQAGGVTACLRQVAPGWHLRMTGWGRPLSECDGIGGLATCRMLASVATAAASHRLRAEWISIRSSERSLISRELIGLIPRISPFAPELA
jgi:hypothetical protein